MAGARKVQAGRLPPWEVDALPQPPSVSWSPRALVGPGIVMAGASIGGGEWLLGPAMTAKYGAGLMWVAALSILFQACYNQEVMRYALYCGEPMPLGCFRTAPGPAFWTIVYLVLDFGAIWPYLAANAAVPLASAFLGHIPGAAVDLAGRPIAEATQHSELALKQWMSYGIFLLAFAPLVFGGKVYNALEKLMTAKLLLVLGFLTFIGICYVAPLRWWEIFSGFFGSPRIENGRFSLGWIPKGNGLAGLDFGLIAAFAAIAGAGGLNNANFASFCRDKGWGMGSRVGAIPSAVGGSTIRLSHIGKVFPITADNLDRWSGWMRLIRRDQWCIWVFGCLLGVAIPSLVSLEFVGDLNRNLTEHELAAVTAMLISERTGFRVFWWLTLLCGFLVLWPSLLNGIEGFARRWTDIIWTANPMARTLGGNQVKYIYYGLLLANCAFGLTILAAMPNPFAMVKMSAILLNYGLAFSMAHVLIANCTLLPRELRPGWPMRIGLACASAFFIAVSVLATTQYVDQRRKTAENDGLAVRASNSRPDAIAERMHQ